MEYFKDAPFADVFLCNGELDFHDYYYVSPDPPDEEPVFYCINRAGIESRSPELLFVERKRDVRYCELFCIFSGRGRLVFRDRMYPLGANQIVVLPAGEPHMYESDRREPLGMAWVEFCGGDSRRLMRHIADTQGAVIEGDIFQKVSAGVALLQQKLMMDEKKNLSLEIYQILLELLQNESRFSMKELSGDMKDNLSRAEAYMDSHLAEKITNKKLAQVCGISVPYFIRLFRRFYGKTPQEYVMERRIRRSKELLMHSCFSVEEISEMLGFCNTSHFIRRFRREENLTPAQYRRFYGLETG